MATKAANNGDGKEMPAGYTPSSGPVPPETKEQSSGVTLDYPDSPILRLPEGLVVLSEDNTSGNKTYPGQVRIKYGPNKADWLKLSYMSMKKIIDMCNENKVQFNSQLKKEREQIQVTDL